MRIADDMPPWDGPSRIIPAAEMARQRALSGRAEAGSCPSPARSSAVSAQMRQAAHAWMDAWLDAQQRAVLIPSPAGKLRDHALAKEARALADRVLAGEILTQADAGSQELWNRARMSALGVVAAGHAKLMEEDRAGARIWLEAEQRRIRGVFDAE